MTPKAREAAHIERLDSLIAPLSKYDLPADDAPKIKGAIEALAANKPDKAAEFAKDVSDPIGRKLIAWYRLRQGQGEARDYLAFLDANPDWPSRDYLRQRMEEALFIEGGSTDLDRHLLQGRQGAERLGARAARLRRAGARQQGQGEGARLRSLAQIRPSRRRSSRAS